jgi:hypothetical protein
MDVRCPNCRTEASEWAGHCPKCNSSLDDAELIQVAGRQAVSVVGPKARSSRPNRIIRRSAVLVVAMLAGLAAVGAGRAYLGSGGDHRGVVLPDDLRHRLFFVAEPMATQVIRADGTVVQRLPQLAAAGYPVQPVTTANHAVVFVHQGEAYRLGPDMRSPARRVGAADRLFPADGGNVGLEVGASATEQRFVAYMGADGTVAGPLSTGDALPAGSIAVDRLVGRLLILSGDGHLRFVPTPAVDIGPVGSVIGAAHAAVAWTARVGCAPDGGCPLHISDFEGTERLISPPGGFGGFVGGGAFSPDGASLGAFVFSPTSQRPTLRMVLIDTRTLRVRTIGPPLPGGEPLTVPQTNMAPWPFTATPIGSAQWSPDGTWLFFSGLNGPMYAQLVRGGDPLGSPIAMPLSASYAFAPL